MKTVNLDAAVGVVQTFQTQDNQLDDLREETCQASCRLFCINRNIVMPVFSTYVLDCYISYICACSLYK